MFQVYPGMSYGSSMTFPAHHLSEGALHLLDEKRSTRLPPVQERRMLRINAGFNLREMGCALGIGASTAHRWETKAVRLPPRRAQAYLALLDAWRELAAIGAPVTTGQTQK